MPPGFGGCRKLPQPACQADRRAHAEHTDPAGHGIRKMLAGSGLIRQTPPTTTEHTPSTHHRRSAIPSWGRERRWWRIGSKGTPGGSRPSARRHRLTASVVPSVTGGGALDSMRCVAVDITVAIAPPSLTLPGSQRPWARTLASGFSLLERDLPGAAHLDATAERTGDQDRLDRVA